MCDSIFSIACRSLWLMVVVDAPINCAYFLCIHSCFCQFLRLSTPVTDLFCRSLLTTSTTASPASADSDVGLFFGRSHFFIWSRLSRPLADVLRRSLCFLVSRLSWTCFVDPCCRRIRTVNYSCVQSILQYVLSTVNVYFQRLLSRRFHFHGWICLSISYPSWQLIPFVDLYWPTPCIHHVA